MKSGRRSQVYGDFPVSLDTEHEFERIQWGAFHGGVGTHIRQQRIQARRVAGIIFAFGRSCFSHCFCICLVEVSGVLTINRKPQYQRCQGQRLASSFYGRGAQHPERLIHLLKMTQPADVKRIDLCLLPSVNTAYSSLDGHSLEL